MNISDKVSHIIFTTIVVFATMYMIIGGSLKFTSDQDEIWAYGAANSTRIHLTYDYDRENAPPITATEYRDYLTVQSDERFNYFIPFWGMYNDNHPPLFFYALHTVCSFFPDTYSPWYGLSINIVFFVFSLVAFYFLTRTILPKNNLASLFCVFLFAFSTCALRSFLFVRMYGMLMFFVIFYAYAGIKYFKTKEKKYLLYYFLGIFYGGMTHYSSWVFCALLTLTLCISLVFLSKSDKEGFKQIKGGLLSALKFGSASIAALICAILAYPPLIMQFSYTTPIKNAWSNRAAAITEGSYLTFFRDEPLTLIAEAFIYGGRFFFPSVDWYDMNIPIVFIVAGLVTVAYILIKIFVTYEKDFSIFMLIIPSCLGAFVFSGVYKGMSFVGRYYGIFFPFLLLFLVCIAETIVKFIIISLSSSKKIQIKIPEKLTAISVTALFLVFSFLYIPRNFTDAYTDKNDWVTLFNADFDQGYFKEVVKDAHIIIRTDNRYYSSWNTMHFLSLYCDEIVDVRVINSYSKFPKTVDEIRNFDTDGKIIALFIKNPQKEQTSHLIEWSEEVLEADGFNVERLPSVLLEKQGLKGCGFTFEFLEII